MPWFRALASPRPGKRLHVDPVRSTDASPRPPCPSARAAPFHNLDRIEVGDTIEIQTADGTWTYTVDTGPTIVQPSDVWVVDPVPGAGAEAEPTERRITLTTCHPRYGSSQRMYVSGVLTSGEEV